MSTPPKSFVYIIESLKDPRHHYVGLTSDPCARLASHNAGIASRYSVKYRPWRMLVVLEFADPARAAQFERYLKSASGRAFAKRRL